MTRRNKEAGFTLLELTIASIILWMFCMVVTQLIISGQSAHQLKLRRSKLTDATHAAMDQLNVDAAAAVRVFGNDTDGNAYRNVLAPWTDHEPLASGRLPQIDEVGTFERDQLSLEKTGSELLFARHAWSDTYTCSSGAVYTVDVRRIQWIYLREARVRDQIVPGYNVCVWVSEPLASAPQVDRITDAADQLEVLMHLHDATPDDEGLTHTPVTVVWDSDGNPTVSGTFRQIQPDGFLNVNSSAPRSSTWTIERAPHDSDPGIFHSTLHVVSSNADGGTVARYGIPDKDAGSGVGFPHGLEFQVIGPASARQVLLHLTTRTVNEDGLRVRFDIQDIITVREG